MKDYYSESLTPLRPFPSGSGLETPTSLNFDANPVPPPMALPKKSHDATNEVVYIRDSTPDYDQHHLHELGQEQSLGKNPHIPELASLPVPIVPQTVPLAPAEKAHVEESEQAEGPEAALETDPRGSEYESTENVNAVVTTAESDDLPEVAGNSGDAPPAPKDEDSLEVAERHVTEHLIADAPNIVAATEVGTVIISGPHGSGKSHSLIPALKQQYEASGHRAVDLDVQGYEDLPEDVVVEILTGELPQLDTGQKGVLILDEAGAIAGAATRVIEAAHSHGYDVIAAIAHDIDVEPDEPEAAWRAAAGLDAPVFRQPGGRLPDALAREYVSENAARMGSPPEVAAWLADNIPPYLPALHAVPFARTIADARRSLLANLESFERSIPQAELVAIRARLAF